MSLTKSLLNGLIAFIIIGLSGTAYAATTYQVAFDANGGAGVPMTNQALTYGIAQPLTANTYTKGALVFSRWNTAAEHGMLLSQIAQSSHKNFLP
jgi:hypothetical protein